MKQSIRKLLCTLLVIGILMSSSMMAFAATAGDVNSDGTVNSTDALCILMHSVGKTPSKFDKGVADMNGDGNINSTDALAVLKITVGLDNPNNPLKMNKNELIKFYNDSLKKSYKQSKITATKTEHVDIAVSGIDIGNINLDADRFAQNIIENNTKNNDVLQIKSFSDGVSEDGTTIDQFVVPTNLYAEAVKSIYATRYGNGYKIVIVLKEESCPHTETAEYNASCTWPLDINVIDFGVALAIKNCVFNYPGTKLTATIDSEGRVSEVVTEMPLAIANAEATALGVNISVASINGKWTCRNAMAYSESSSNGGSSNNDSSSNRPEVNQPPSSDVTLNEYLEALKASADRFKESIKVNEDEDGNITIESVDGTDTGLFSFKYSQKDKIFVTAENAWQRNFGYNEVYDASAPVLAITYDTMRVKFNYGGLEWMIQYWKGQYGMTMIGAEIGVYNRPEDAVEGTHYECADDETEIQQSMTVYRRESSTSNNFKQIFSRSLSNTWWCTGFIPGTLGEGHYNVTAEETARLKVDSKIVLKTPEMAQAFIQGLKEVDLIYHNAPQSTRGTSFKEAATVEEYEKLNNKAMYFLEDDGVTVRVCWR